MDGRDESPAISRRHEILLVSAAEFIRSGYAGTSMSKIARALGMQKASLYHHFPGKEELFVACIDEAFAGTHLRLEAIASDPNLSIRARFEAALDELYAIYLGQEMGMMPALIAEAAARIPAIGEQFFDGLFAQQDAAIMKVIEQGVAAGEFRVENREALVHMIFGPIIMASMSVQMLSGSSRRDCLVPLDELRRGHKAMLVAAISRTG